MSQVGPGGSGSLLSLSSSCHPVGLAIIGARRGLSAFTGWPFRRVTGPDPGRTLPEQTSAIFALFNCPRNCEKCDDSSRRDGPYHLFCECTHPAIADARRRAQHSLSEKLPSFLGHLRRAIDHDALARSPDGWDPSDLRRNAAAAATSVEAAL